MLHGLTTKYKCLMFFNNLYGVFGPRHVVLVAIQCNTSAFLLMGIQVDSLAGQ